MKFEKYRISDQIKSNLAEMGFLKTTDIQFKAIPPIMNGEDVLAIAQTGTGKTAAFAIPVVNDLQTNPLKGTGVGCLVLTPTRELTEQIGKVFSQITKNTGVRSYSIYGGVDQDPQIDQLSGGVDVLVANPGRMFDLISQGHLDVSSVRTLVIDEADLMLDLGFSHDISSIKKKIPRRHQTLFFSATINPKIKKLAYSQISSDAMRIQVSPKNMVSKNISHFLTFVEMDEKRHLLTNFIKESPPIKLIVFVRTQVRAERVLKHLLKEGFDAYNIHGGMEQEEREKNLKAFRSKSEGILVSTDVSARGIDLPNVSHVINYDLPDHPENYVHRVGRTGRGFATGDALSFCAPGELDKLKSIEEFLGLEIPRIKAQKAFTESFVDSIDDLEISEIIEQEEIRVGKKRKK
jgi:ATP-dependent RNA helicase RhlE